MGDQDDLYLNELHRYRKTSSKVVLEVHSHCEVPAGCGGVVLRWRRPGEDIGVSIWTYLGSPHEGILLDGKRLAEQRATVTPGPHVIALVVDDPGPEGFLLLHASLEPNIASAKRRIAVSRADAGFRASITEPGEGWQLPGFDDAGFTPLVEGPVPAPEKEKWRHEALLRYGAKGLGLPPLSQASAPRAWVRWTFRVDLEGFS